MVGPTYGMDVSAFEGHVHGVICLGGMRIILPSGTINFCKTEQSLSAQQHAWQHWVAYYMGKYANDVGFVFMEAADVQQGAERLHRTLHKLQELHDTGLFDGTVVVMGHCTGAASIIHYFAEARRGKYDGDYPVESFVGLSAPDSLRATIPVAVWSGWPSASELCDIDDARHYVENHGIRGIYAYDRKDQLSGPLQLPTRPVAREAERQNQAVASAWRTVTCDIGGQVKDLQEAHLRLLRSPHQDRGDRGDLPNAWDHVGIEKIVDELP